MIVRINNKSVYYDAGVYKNLSFVKTRVLQYNDLGLMIADGRPSTGKSTCMFQWAWFLSDGKFSLDDVCYSLDEFGKRLDIATKGDVVLLDEGFCFNKRKTQSEENMRILGMLQKIRSKQCFVIIILPSVYDLDKNLILNLCDVFFHFYRKDFGLRGQYYVYNRMELKKLWLKCRQYLNYNKKVARPNLRAKFTKFFVLDEQEYEKKKQASISKMLEPSAKITRHIMQRNRLIIKIKQMGLPVEDIANLIELEPNGVNDVLKRGSKYVV
jgi:hypothetical protein